MSGVSPQDLAEADLIRELAHLHRTRHETFLHGSPTPFASTAAGWQRWRASTYDVIPTARSIPPEPVRVPGPTPQVPDRPGLTLLAGWVWCWTSTTSCSARRSWRRRAVL